MFAALRIILVSVFLVSGFYMGKAYEAPLFGVGAGFALGLIALLMEQALKKVALGAVLGAVSGLALGVFTASMAIVPLKGLKVEDIGLIRFVIGSLLGYGGFLAGAKLGEKKTVADMVRSLKGQGSDENLKILDTSVIIDGRIADIVEAGFLEGVFILPQFILQELQYIADSPDPMKRARGRRGLDVMHKIQKMGNIIVRIVDTDFPKIREVDAKLVALAKRINAKVITNDFNLNKVAELQGVTVLNINELSNAIKPVVLPGEVLKVFVIKEGKEHNQGVAYLDDGTMVVVDNARKLIGRNVDVTVTSVLQTTAGRMIFTKPKDEYDREEAKAGK